MEDMGVDDRWLSRHGEIFILDYQFLEGRQFLRLYGRMIL